MASVKEQLLSKLMERVPLQSIPYQIHSYSSFSSSYRPENILAREPDNPKSRWSANSGSGEQFLTLAVEPNCVPLLLVFGKFKERHVCNLKEFVVEGGPNVSSMSALVHGGLRNDSAPEAFLLFPPDSPLFAPIPLRFLRVRPIAAHGINYNFSIWHIELRGLGSPRLCAHIATEFQQRRLDAALDSTRLFLSLLTGRERSVPRQLEPKRGPADADARALLCAVVGGDYSGAERCLEQMIARGRFSEPFRHAQPSLYFEKVPASAARPDAVGGHQLVADPVRDGAWFFGGWNGTADTKDLWFFHCATGTWERVGPTGMGEPWPEPRSCHRLVLYRRADALVLFARFFQTPPAAPPSLWLFSIADRTWREVAPRGDVWPPSRYDHQMLIVEEGDDASQDELVIIGGTTGGAEGAALWRYNFASGEFRAVELDGALPVVPAISNHAAVHIRGRDCIVVGGHTSAGHIKETSFVDLQTGLKWPIAGHDGRGPSLGATVRGTLLPSGQIMVYAGIQYTLRQTHQHWDNSSHSVWTFNTATHAWKKVCVLSNTAEQQPPSQDRDARCLSLRRHRLFALPDAGATTNVLLWSSEDLRRAAVESALVAARARAGIPPDPLDFGPDGPCARFAHQFVLVRPDLALLYGGNPNLPGSSTTERLNDLWKVHIFLATPELVAPALRYVLRRARTVERAAAAATLDLDARARKATRLIAELREAAAPLQSEAWKRDLQLVVRAILGSPADFANRLVPGGIPADADLTQALRRQAAALFGEFCGVLPVPGDAAWEWSARAPQN